VNKFKYRVINNHRQYLTNSLEEYLRESNYRGESLNIEMAPRDGWFDTNGNRCAMSAYGPKGEKLSEPRAVVLGSWEYEPFYICEDVHPLANLFKAGLLDASAISILEGGNVPILCTRYNERGYSAEVVFDTSGKDEHIVRHYIKHWRSILRFA
jgi:hypothetical protein